MSEPQNALELEKAIEDLYSFVREAVKAIVPNRVKLLQGTLSLRDFAKQTGVSPSTLSRFLNGKPVSLKTIKSLHTWLASKPLREPSATP